jgi:hypothetical protein
MVIVGHGYLLSSDESNDLVQFETDEGVKTAAEMLGLENISEEEKPEYKLMGESMVDAGYTLQRQLLAGCVDGPILINNERGYVCTSSEAGEIAFTAEDLNP